MTNQCTVVSGLNNTSGEENTPGNISCFRAYNPTVEK
jgi:hypothetical protein